MYDNGMGRSCIIRTSYPSKLITPCTLPQLEIACSHATPHPYHPPPSTKMYTLNPAFPTLTTGLHSRDSTLPESLPPSTPPIPLPLTDSPSPLPTDILRPLARTEDEYVYVDTELPQELRVALIRKGLLSLEGYPRSEEMREVLRRKVGLLALPSYIPAESSSSPCFFLSFFHKV